MFHKCTLLIFCLLKYLYIFCDNAHISRRHCPTKFSLKKPLVDTTTEDVIHFYYRIALKATQKH